MANKKKAESDFDLEDELQNLEKPRMFIAGFKEFIKSTNTEIKSKKDFDKLIKDYSEMKIGGE